MLDQICGGHDIHFKTTKLHYAALNAENLNDQYSSTDLTNARGIFHKAHIVTVAIHAYGRSI